MGYTMNLLFGVILLMVWRPATGLPARRELRSSSAPDANNLNGSPDLKNVERTVKEVEELIKQDPALPRLTRGEILDILENITRTDLAKLTGGKRDQKAVMLVLPYSPDSVQNGDMQALYTKPPITQIVGEKLIKPQQDKVEYKRKRKPVEFRKEISPTTTTRGYTTQASTTTRANYFNEEFDMRSPETQSTVIHTTRIKRPEIVTARITTSTKMPRRRTTQRFSNHKYPDEGSFIVQSTPEAQKLITAKTTAKPFITNQGIKIISPPQLKPTKGSSKFEKPIYKPLKSTTTTTPSVVQDMQLPDNFKDVLKNLDILIKENPKYSSQYDSLSPLPTRSSLTEENVKDILASMGAYQTTLPTTTTKVNDIQSVANNLSPEMKDLLMNFGLLPDPNKKPEKIESYSHSIEPSSDVDPESYTAFKPLPESSSSNTQEGMEELLASFGLGQRSQKSIAISKPQNQINSNLDVVPDNFKSILSDIGLTYKDIKQLNESTKKTEPKQHVFSPSDSQYATEDELKRLNKLMGVIKQLEKLNGSVTDEDLKHIDLEGLKQLVGSLNTPLHEQHGPNPLDFDSGLEKNEVKRQQSTTTTTESSKVTESRNPSLADLEDSFGGSSDTVSVTTTTSTERPNRSGFYYLVDWNTFLDIDNQKGRRVNLRFQPTIGDPKRFYDIRVP